MAYWLYAMDRRNEANADLAIERYGPFESEEQCLNKWNDICRWMLEDYAYECCELKVAILDEVNGWMSFKEPGGNVRLIFALCPEKSYELNGEIVVEERSYI